VGREEFGTDQATTAQLTNPMVAWRRRNHRRCNIAAERPSLKDSPMTKSHVPLKEIISTDVVSIDPHDTLREALSVMVENRVSALPVVDSRMHCIGVISVTDLVGMTKELSDELNALSESGGWDHQALVQKLEHADLLTEQVKDLMSTDVISVRVDSTLQHAARQMLRNRVHRLVVLDDQKQLVGVVSTMDLLAAYSDEKNNHKVP
jgi:CBS domain-containing protein